jgi:hypothetical protein
MHDKSGMLKAHPTENVSVTEEREAKTAKMTILGNTETTEKAYRKATEAVQDWNTWARDLANVNDT